MFNAIAARSRSTLPQAALVAIVLSILLIATIGIALTVGSVSIPFHTVVEVVLRRFQLGNFDVTLLDDQIVWQLRMPRVLGAAATGAGLAIAGAVLQSLTRNDLADPYLLGISGGATVGAVSVIVLGVSFGTLIGSAAITAFAFVGAVLALIAVLVLAAGRSGDLPPARTILAGVAVGQVCAAYTAFLVIFSGNRDAAREVLSWTLGSLAGLRWGSAIFLLLATFVSIIVIMMFATSLDAFAFGETAARTLGVNVNALRWTLMIGTAFLTASLVAFTGAIGFVGLIVPHMVRMLFGPRHHSLLPLSALLGAVMLVWADTAARSLISGQEIPVGVVTAAVGAPLFGWLLRRNANHS